MSHLIEKLSRWLNRFEELVMSGFLATATLISFFQVVLRYGFSFSITWASELATFMLIWSALIGSAYGVRNRVHIGVDSLVKRLPEKAHRAALVVSGLLCVGYTLMLSVLGYQFIRFLMMIGQLSPDLELPLWIVFLAVPLGSVLMALRFIQTTWEDMKRPLGEKGIEAELPPLLRQAMEHRAQVENERQRQGRTQYGQADDGDDTNERRQGRTQYGQADDGDDNNERRQGRTQYGQADDGDDNNER